jgi:CDP-2,3-bis-(O-geranylgeranyl)-sn-glycerol synthase
MSLEIFNIYIFVEALYLILPAYAANGLTPLVGRKKNLHPVDGGRMFKGHRLFGDGKSWEGLAFGTFVAVVISLVQMAAFPFLPWEMSEVALTIVPMTPLLGLALGLGAMLGDIGGSFIKRRLNRPRGSPFPLLDQLDFIAGSILLAALIVTVKIEWVLILIVLTPILHVIANVIGFRIGIKKTPW